MPIFFDDGLVDTYFNARPIVKNYNDKIIFAIVCNIINKVFPWDPPYSDMTMTELQIEELINDGWEIASHSMTHRNLITLSWNEVESEIIDSKKWIIDRFNVVPEWFVVPFGGNFVTKEMLELIYRYYKYCRYEGKYLPFIFHNISRDLEEKTKLIELVNRNIKV